MNNKSWNEMDWVERNITNTQFIIDAMASFLEATEYRSCDIPGTGGAVIQAVVRNELKKQREFMDDLLNGVYDNMRISE